jgi:hypothetical protein
MSKRKLVKILPSAKLIKAAPSKFSRLLAAMIETRGILKQDFARETGVSPTVLSQLLADCYPEPPVGFCIRSALVSRLAPSQVLRAAGHDDIADGLDAFYKATPELLSDFERELVETVRALDPEQARAAQFVLRTFLIGLATPQQQATR